MSDNLWDEFETDDEGQTPGDLRNLVKKLQKQLKTVQGQLEEKDSTINELTNKVKATSLRDLLTEAKIDPKFARLAERDGVEPTAEAVKKWVDDNKDFYSFTPAAAASEQDDAGDDQGEGEEDHVDPDLVAAVAQGQATEGVGRPSGSSTVTETIRQAMANPGQFKSREDMIAFLKDLGAPTPDRVSYSDD
jgi:hypothetical protein